MTRKKLIALLEDVKGRCEDLYLDAPDPNEEDDDKYMEDAASFCDCTVFEYFHELAVQLHDAIYKLESGQPI
jgi:hypothetical protein